MVDANNAMITVTLHTMAGNCIDISLPLMASVRELALKVRELLKMPIAVQKLIVGTEKLMDHSLRLVDVFGQVDAVEIGVVRVPFTPEERAELNLKLVRAVAEKSLFMVRELIMEGAQVDFQPDGGSNGDTSVSLSHWDQRPEAPSNKKSANANEKGQSAAAVNNEKPSDTHSDTSQEMGDDITEDSEDDISEDAEGSGTLPCGGITPLMMALAVGDSIIEKDLRTCGAKEVDMTPHHISIAAAFSQRDFPDVVKHIAAGADVNVQLSRGEGVEASETGSPLHACCALHRVPGSYEVAQLLIKKKADLGAGDAEGDTPLSHAKYFHAPEMFHLMQGNGAKVAGPYYNRLGH